MKKEFINKDKSILVYTCDNLGEYLAEFVKYRKAVRESDDWNLGFDKFYGEGRWTFYEDCGTGFNYRKNDRITEFLHKDYNNDFEGRNGRLELELAVDLESLEWKSQREKVNQTLKEIWKTGENKNPYGLDLNWPAASKPENKNDDEKNQGGGSNQNLPKLRTQAINLIREELAQNPPVDPSELTNQNWEKEIGLASAESAITDIRDRVLAEIRNKRMDNKIKGLEKKNKELEEQLKKETEKKTIGIIISVSGISVLSFLLLFYWLSKKKKKKLKFKKHITQPVINSSFFN